MKELVWKCIFFFFTYCFYSLSNRNNDRKNNEKLKQLLYHLFDAFKSSNKNSGKKPPK